MFKITATIVKAGGAPVEWIRFSRMKMTAKECESLLFRAREAGRSFGEHVRIENFCCEKINPGTDNPA